MICPLATQTPLVYRRAFRTVWTPGGPSALPQVTRHLQGAGGWGEEGSWSLLHSCTPRLPELRAGGPFSTAASNSSRPRQCLLH